MPQVVIGVDVGTSSTKAVALSESGQVAATATVAHATVSPRRGWFEHDAEDAWWGGLSMATRRLMEDLPKPYDVVAVGLSGCGPCVVPVDAAGNALRSAILYGIDTRATKQVLHLQERFPAEVALHEFGQLFSSQVAGAKVDWLIENEPSVYAASRWLLTVNGFLAMRLTGDPALDHHQAAYFAPYYRDGAWDTTEASEPTLEGRLPALRWSSEISGRVTASASEVTTLPAGIPVIIGSSDGLTGAVGAGASAVGDTVINYGSTIGITTFAPPGAMASEGIWRTPGCTPAAASLVAALSSGGSILQWFSETLMETNDPTNHHGEALLIALAAEAGRSTAGADGLIALPYFQGERSPFYDPHIRGVLMGLTVSHTRGDLYRALLEGLAYAVRDALEHLAAAGAEIDILRAVGGGTSSELLLQVMSDVTRVDQTVVTPHLGAPVGAALLAAEAVGLHRTGGGATWVTEGSVIKPDPTLGGLYDRGYRRFQSAVQALRPLFQAPDAIELEAP